MQAMLAKKVGMKPTLITSQLKAQLEKVIINMVLVVTTHNKVHEGNLLKTNIPNSERKRR
jgi:hypothetical protein